MQCYWFRRPKETTRYTGVLVYVGQYCGRGFELYDTVPITKVKRVKVIGVGNNLATLYAAHHH